ncbi:MAG: hypothetical protein IAE99_02915 [Rhodothermales bacterium]|nr:hypothetical protein [Rhodothermales bacterium]MCA0270361.1 hypothetical protein [Bacteroidota bacterium]
MNERTLRLRMLDERTKSAALEDLWHVLDHARSCAEEAVNVAREALEAAPETPSGC